MVTNFLVTNDINTGCPSYHLAQRRLGGERDAGCGCLQGGGFAASSIDQGKCRAKPLQAEEAELYWVHSCLLASQHVGRNLDRWRATTRPPAPLVPLDLRQGGSGKALETPHRQLLTPLTSQSRRQKVPVAGGAGRDTSDRWRSCTR